MKKKAISAVIIASTIAANVAASEECVASATERKDNNMDKNVRKSANEETPILNGIRVNKQLINMNYSKGVTIVPKYIVIHDTDNRAFGANAKANRDYFANHPEALASAHYTVDQNNIIQVLENTWRGWHVGDGNNKQINNSTTIGIELCVNPENDFNKTLENGIALTKYLMNKYNIPADHVVRHYDASGKICPKMMIKDKPQLWTYFKNVIASLDVSKPSGNASEEVKQVATGKIINVSTRLNIRENSSGNSNVVSYVQANSYVEIYGESGDWYKVSYNENGVKKYGFVSKSYVRITNGSTSGHEVNTIAKPETKPNNNLNKSGKVVNVETSLNVRSAASKSSLAIGYLKNNDSVKINYEENGWYNISFSGNRTGFVKAEFIKIIDNNTSNEQISVPVSNTNNSSTVNNTNSSEKKKGRVYNVSTCLNIRQGAGTSHLVVAYALNDSELEILEESGDWYKVNYNGKIGYANKAYIKKLSEDKPVEKNTPKDNGYKQGFVVNVSTTLNVRTGPGIKNLVVGYLLPNAKVKVKGNQDGWLNIIFETNVGEKEGYVKAEYVKY